MFRFYLPFSRTPFVFLSIEKVTHLLIITVKSYGLTNQELCYFRMLTKIEAEPHSSVGSVVDLRTGGRWFDPRLGKNSFRGLMIVIATRFIPLSPLSVVSTMVKWGSRQWPGKILCGALVKRTTRKHE